MGVRFPSPFLFRERGSRTGRKLGRIAAFKAARDPEGETYLDVHFVLGSRVEELVARFGEPDAYRPQLGNQPYGNIKWNDLKGVKVFAILKDSLCAYVNYGFKKMDPFDETRGLQDHRSRAARGGAGGLWCPKPGSRSGIHSSSTIT